MFVHGIPGGKNNLTTRFITVLVNINDQSNKSSNQKRSVNVCEVVSRLD